METKVNKNEDDGNSDVQRRRLKNFQEHYLLTQEEAQSAVTLMDTYLSRGYTKEIVAIALKNDIRVTRQIVRLVKLGKTKNLFLFGCLIEIASENKAKDVVTSGKIKKNLS